MRPKHLYVILTILALALLLYAPSLLRRPGPGPEAETSGFRPGDLDGERPTLVRIVDGESGDTVRLERAGEAWQMNGNPADSTHVADLIAALDTARAARVIARNPRNHARLGVTDETGRTVEVRSASGRSRRFHLGPRDDLAEGYPIRAAGDSVVYLIPDPLGGYLSRRTDTWRERTIAAVDTAPLREILIRRGNEETTMRRAEEGWTVNGSAADSAAVSELLRRLALLEATGFPSDSVAREADFREPDGVLSAFAEDIGDVTGRRLAVSLRFLAREGEPWLVRRADEGPVFEVNRWLLEYVLPTRERLLGDGRD